MMSLPANWKLLSGTLLLSCLFIGAGCASNTPKQTTATSTPQTTTTTEKVVVKKPEGVDTVDYAMTLCQRYGNTPVLQYDSTTKTTVTYCRFSDGTACEAVAYITGACSSGSANRQELTIADGTPLNLRTCSAVEDPVCGINGVTYSNECIAALQKVVVSHTGVCTKTEQEAAAPATAGGTGSTGAGQTGSTGTGTTPSAPPTGTPLWIAALPSIAGSQETPSIESCTYGATRVFYMEQSCPNCFSTLYSNDGKVMCYPDNDISGSCPDYFNKDKHSSSCKPL